MPPLQNHRSLRGREPQKRYCSWHLFHFGVPFQFTQLLLFFSSLLWLVCPLCREWSRDSQEWPQRPTSPDDARDDPIQTH